MIPILILLDALLWRIFQIIWKNFPSMHQNAEQKLEVEVNVKHLRIVFY